MSARSTRPRGGDPGGRLHTFLPGAPGRLLASATLFVLFAGAFFALIGRNPVQMLGLLLRAAAGDGYAITESLVKATPILLCALASAIPARLGLISVGAEGQLYFGALVGTGYVLTHLDGSAATLLPATILAGAFGGAAWALLPALLKAALDVNETISTLMTNYVAALLVTWLVHGPWKNPQSLGWPATVDFPDAARLPTYFDSRVHLGLWLAVALAVLLHWFVTYTRWGLTLDILRSNPRAAASAGLRLAPEVLLTMAVGGLLAGVAGIAETAAIQQRLQSNLSGGAGLSGFLVAWLAGNHLLRIVPLALLVGALLAAGDGMQMLANVPSSATLVVQGLLFVAVLLVAGLAGGRRE